MKLGNNFSKKIKKAHIGFFTGFAALFIAALLFVKWYTAPLLTPLASTEVKIFRRTLDKYSFSRLRKKSPNPSRIAIGQELKKTQTFTSYMFTFESDGATVSGLLNLPQVSGKRPVIVLLRGYVDKEKYWTGVGTRRAGETFADAGYVTLAPDFLGYGQSASESSDVLEARFEKPATVLNLIASLSTLSQTDTKRIGIWGHSNGGQIALSVLEITGKPYPTTLWAPVTQGFPSSMLQYIDELPDQGAYLKKQLNVFYRRYFDRDYSIDQHWQNITAPLQIHQGLADEEVDFAQTRSVISRLQELGKNVHVFEYSGEDHNFQGGSAATLLQKDTAFFAKYLGN